MILENNFKIIGTYGDTFYLTEEDLLRKIKASVANKEKLFADAITIARVCEETNFDRRFANGISMAILQYFTDIASNEIMNIENLMALSKCYNSLGSHEKEKQVKEKFLITFLKEICVPKLDSGDRENVKKWIRTKFEEYSTKDKIHFPFIVKQLREDMKKELS